MGQRKARSLVLAAAFLLSVGPGATALAQPLPTSGGEHPYQPELWNDGETGTIQPNTSGYNYVLNIRYGDIPGVNTQWLWPGKLAGTYSYYDSSYLEIDNEQLFIDRVADDVAALGGTFEPIGKYDVCPEGTYKIAIYTYPWVAAIYYRQDADGYWSYKHYLNDPVTRLDFDGDLISDPDEAQRFLPDEWGPEYYWPIGFFAISIPSAGE